MAISTCNVNTNVISDLADAPTLTASELKAKFDKEATDIKKYINETQNIEIEQIINELKTRLENQISDVEKLTQRNIINAWNTANQTVTNRTTINLAGQNRIGTKLTLENNRIVIGEGVSKVQISGSIFFESFTHGNGYLYPSINKNDKWLARAIEPKGVVGSTDFQTVTFAPFTENVEEGDQISLNAYDVGTENITVRGSNVQKTTYLTVEVVE